MKISNTVNHKTVVVNLFAGPGAGKTTCAWEIASELKKAGLVVEYVSEVAKEYVWDGKTDLLDGTLEHQQALYEEQNKRVQRLIGKVDAVVTDSPILLNLLYLKEHNEHFEQEVLHNFKRQKNFNLFVQRGQTFEKEGRIHNLNESIKLDNELKDYLKNNDIFFGTYSYKQMQLCVKNIVTTVTKARKTHSEPERF